MGKHLDRAEILLDLDKYDLAEQELRQEIAENPDSDLAHGSLARCLINQQQIGSETLEILEYALSLNSENDWLHYLLAIYWHIKGDFDRAQAAINVAIELDPNSERYFDILARILFDRGNDQFKTHSRRVLFMILIISRGALWPIGMGILSVCRGYWLRSYLQPVWTPLEQSLSLDPEYLSALNLQTQLLITTNRSHRALTSSLNALEIDPNNDTAHKLHAQVLLRLGKYTAAADHFQSSLRINPSAAEAKDGLLEATRSQYRIYPWLSITNWRGKLVLVAGFLIALAIGISTIWFHNEDILVIFTYLILIPAVCVSFTAKSIFNLLLQLNPNTKLLITNSISIRRAVWGNYLASLMIATIGAAYLFICLLILLNNRSAQSMIAACIGLAAGIFISTATFLPVTDRHRLRSFSVIYQLIVGGLGLINMAIYSASNHVEILDNFFVGLVFLSPIFAIYSARKSKHT
jgi:tetratricopeptide (TPR) repeat protein